LADAVATGEQGVTMFGLDKEWVPVLSPFIASTLTALFGFLLLWRQNRNAKKAAATNERADVYGEFLVRAFSFARRVQAVGQLQLLRTGITEQREVLFGRRKPLDFMEFHDWMDVDFRPLGDAWSCIHMVGSQEAITAADELMLVSGDLMDAAIARDPKRARLAKYFVGERPSATQVQEYKTLLKKFFEAREAFAMRAREELGKEAVRLPLERATQPDPEVPVRWHLRWMTRLEKESRGS
jgi:hypothetical protein